MYQNQIRELPSLSEEKYENIFKVYLDENDYYFYNLLQSIKVPTDLPPGYFELYTVTPQDTLPYISYKLYKTINLWWIICLFNKIDNPTKKLEPGTTLKIPATSLIRLIVQQINTVDE